jgi:hypothetical protein
MSEAAVRAALHDLGDDVAPVDLVGGVWRTAVRRRRLRRAAGTVVMVACVAAAVAVAAGVGMSPRADLAPGPANPDHSHQVDGHPAWLAPRPGEESSLPLTRSSLPGTVALSGSRQDGSEPVVAAVASLDRTGRVTRVRLVDARGNAWRLETDTMDLVVDPFASSFGSKAETPSFTGQSLSPGGRSVAFVTRNGFVVDDIAANGWSFIEAPGADPGLMHGFHWAGPRTLMFGDQQVDIRSGRVSAAAPLDLGGEGRPIRMGARTGQARTNPSGARTAQGGFPVDLPPGQDTGTDTPQAVVVEGTDPALLVLGGARTRGCCPVAGWLDDQRVVYESPTGQGMRLLAWDAASGEVTRLAEITGLTGSDIASFAVGPLDVPQS